ncbi:LysR substrate-binding domain-containing protein [Paraburkholderia sp.]|uniref:LysR substrate-binding domain-containing protein n=1 Tax=Paraburkholderia sp. TaxID=1926495 RepID=UPI002579AACD|nr:LysR substrate-binding domain-containing protein [Paraburkholderia sp.]
MMYSADGGKYFHDRITALLNAAGVRVNFMQFMDQTHTIVALVRAGTGIAIVPASARELCFDDVVFRPVWTPDAYADMDLAWSEDPRSAAVENFRIFAINHFAEVARRR